MSSVDRVVSNATTGVTGTTEDSIATASGRPQVPGLPEPTATWTDATTAALAALADFARKSREGMREVKKAFDASRQAEMRKEVESMREQASEMRSGALMQAATLGLSAACGGASLLTSNNLSRWFALGADASGKFHDPLKGVYEASAKEREADASAARGTTEQAKTNAEDVQELAEAQGELVSKAMDAIRAILDARHAATMGILAQRG